MQVWACPLDAARAPCAVRIPIVREYMLDSLLSKKGERLRPCFSLSATAGRRSDAPLVATQPVDLHRGDSMKRPDDRQLPLFPPGPQPTKSGAHQLRSIFQQNSATKATMTSDPKMNLSFHLIEPGGRIDKLQLAKSLDADRFGIRDAIFDALDLADSAAAFFRGLFPVESPHFWWGEAIALPWHADYCAKSDDDNDSVHPLSIRDESMGIARELFDVADSEMYTGPWPHVTYESEKLTKSDRLKMQGLAVEAMLCVDGFLRHVSAGFIAESVSWLTAAYTNIIECTSQAYRILDSERARAATSPLPRS